MRIVVISYLTPRIVPGGAQQIAYEEYVTAVRSGHEACLIAAMDDQHSRAHKPSRLALNQFQENKNHLLFFPSGYDFKTLSLLESGDVSELQDFVAAYRPDVIHFHHYHRIGVQAIAAVRAAVPNVVVCVTFHEMIAICMANGKMIRRDNGRECISPTARNCNRCFPEIEIGFFERRKAVILEALASADVLTFPSKFLRDIYVEWGLPASKCIIIPNGQMPLAASASPRASSPGQYNRFSFFGQLIDHKGIEVALDALLALRRRNTIPEDGLILKINGANLEYATPGLLEEVEAKANEINSVDDGLAVVDVGPYTREQLPERMAMTDWVLVPSTWREVYGLVLSEAWMFGRPPIVSAIGALAERVTDGVNGLTFPAGDAEALADIMLQVSGSESEWKRLQNGIPRLRTNADMLRDFAAVWRSVGT